MLGSGAALPPQPAPARSSGQDGGRQQQAAPCPICLGEVNNAAYVDTCCHRFCFVCICQGAATRAACPLCRPPFRPVLHTARADDDYQEYVVGSSARRQRTAAREQACSGSPQQRYHLHRVPTNTGPATGSSGPAGRDRAVRDDAALGPSNASARRAAGEHPATPPILHISTVVLQPLRIKLSESRLQ